MKKLLTSSDKIMLALAFLGDAAIEVYTRGNGFGWKRSIFESMSIKNSTFRSSVMRNLKVGNIEKVIDKNGRPCFKLSSPGKIAVERIFPLYKLSGKLWDGKWRVVIFDIPEKQRKSRDLLRTKLISLGFGQMQESVYISPLDVLADIKEFLKTNNLFGYAVVFEAKEMFSSDPKVVADYVWKLDKLNEEYERLLSKMDEKEFEVKELKEELFEILKIDPILPRQFLPDDWVGDEARKRIMSL